MTLTLSFNDEQRTKRSHEQEEQTQHVQPEGEPPGRGDEQEVGLGVGVLERAKLPRQQALALQCPDDRQAIKRCPRMRRDRNASCSAHTELPQRIRLHRARRYMFSKTG